MDIRTYLASLGNTADEVAESLRRQGIKGQRHSRSSCPILNGIYQACPNYWTGLRIYGRGKKPDGSYSYWATLEDFQIMDPTLPQPVINFIGEFDSGNYADLESP